MTGTDRLAARTARTRSLVLAAALLAAFGVLSLFVARAEAVPLSGSTSPLPGSTFEGGDGNQAGSLPRTDWQNVTGSLHRPDPQAGDNIFTGGDKENNPGQWSFTAKDGGSTPHQSNMLDAYAKSDPLSLNTFLYLAFTREETSGTTYLAFELNKRPDLWDNGHAMIPCRSTGDIIVSLQVNGNSPDMILQRWTSSATDSATGCATAGGLTDYKTFADNVDAQAAINAASITNYLPTATPWPNDTIPASLFGESSLNLSTLLAGALGSPCFDFASIWMHSRSSTSDTSQMQDYIAPVPLIARSCTASGTKFHDLDADGVRDAGEPGLAGFRIWADYDNDGVRDAGEPFGDTDAGGDYVITDIKDPSGTYSLREQLTPPATGTGGWHCSAPGTTGTGGDFACSHDGIDVATTPNAGGKDFGNYKQATVKVEKQTVPDGAAGAFAFSFTGKPGFALSDGDVQAFTVSPGTYTATEAAQSDYALTDVSCSGDADSSGDKAARTATFRAQSGETIKCVFTNTRKQGRLTVRKLLDPTTDPGKFDLKIGSDVVVDDGGHLAEGTRTLDTGTDYTVSEAGGAGTSLARYDSAIECKDGATTVAAGPGTSLSGVPVIDGHDVVCTFTNTRRPGSITVVKDLVPATDGGRFDLKVDGAVVKAGAGDGDQGSKDVAPGSYTVSETGAGTDLAKYDKSIACLKNGQPSQSGDGASLSGVTVDSNDVVVCTITNTRLGTVEVEKQTAPATDDSFHFGSDLPGGGFDLSDDEVKTVTRVVPGPYSVTEDAVAGWDLTDLACAGDDDFVRAGATAKLDVDPGETVHCVFTNTERGSVTVTKTEGGGPAVGTWKFRLTGGPDAVDITKDTTADGNPMSFGNLKPGAYELCEIDLPAGWHSSLENGCADITLEPGEAEMLTVDNTRPATLVVKEGNLLVHHGDTITYTFDVSNAGNTPLENVSVEDARCDAAPVRDAANDKNADGDALLEGAGTPDATKSEVWRFTCSRVVPVQHADNEENPIVNVATAHAFDRAGNEVTATDNHSTRIIHPGIAVDKTLRRGNAGSFVQGPIKVHAGDTIQYRFEVSNAGDTELTVAFGDPRCDQGSVTGPTGDGDQDGKLDVGETWVYRCSHAVTDQDPDPLENTVTVTGTDALGGPKGTVTDTDTAVADILKPGTLVVKEGNQFAYPGDTVTFTFAVTNNGNTPLSDVTVTDDRCAPVTGPVEKQNDNGDNLLDTGEKWIFTCSKQIPPGHKIGDENPIRNVATATGKDELGKQVTSTDDHKVQVLHPAIDIEKTGPATALVGTALGYTLTVTNPGDVPFASQQVAVTDPRCEAPPAGPNTGADATPGQLDPGDRWTYTCTAQTTGQPAGTFVNTAKVTARDFNGRTVTDADEFPTLLEAQGVLPAPEIVNGTARLRGPSGCVRKRFRVTVRGRHIRQVTFYRDGKRIKRIHAKRGQQKFSVRIKPGRKRGVHRITARVRFVAASQTKTRTLRLSYQRCRRQVVRPRFTG